MAKYQKNGHTIYHGDALDILCNEMPDESVDLVFVDPPFTFVVKTNESADEILQKIAHQAEEKYQIKAIVKKYIESVEEVINIPKLMEIFDHVLAAGKASIVIEEIVLQSRVEFNVEASA